MRSIVDLPQPDGPTKTRNSPSSTSRSMPLMTSTVPKDLRTPRRLTRPMAQAPALRSARHRATRSRYHSALSLGVRACVS